MGEDTDKSLGSAVPISIDRKLLAGEGLNAGDLSDFDDEGITADDANADFRTHNFHTGNIMVSVYCLLYTSPSPRDQRGSRMPSSA